jgi:hypothetical protein
MSTCPLPGIPGGFLQFVLDDCPGEEPLFLYAISLLENKDDSSSSLSVCLLLPAALFINMLNYFFFIS